MVESLLHKKSKLATFINILCVTNIFEWYEFTVSGYLAFVIGVLFFPKTTTSLLLIQSFSTFALGYMARPIGALFWARIANKYGINFVLKNTIVMMSIPTFLIGILPTYSTIGVFATISLVGLRLIQGFAAGSELPTSMIYTHGLSNSANKNFMCSLINLGGMSGVFLSSFLIFLLYLIFNESTIIAWAWRIPFVLGLPLSLIIIKFRKYLPELKVETMQVSKLDNHPKFWLGVLEAAAIVSFAQVASYLIMVWMPTYLIHSLHISQLYARTSNTISLVLLLLVIPLFGYLGTKISYKKLLITGILLITIFSYPLIYCLPYTNFLTLLLIQIAFSIMIGSIQGSVIPVLCEFFHPKNRSLGMAFGFVFPTAIFGSTAPVVCSYFIYLLKINSFPGIYVTLWGILAIVILSLRQKSLY